MEKRDNNTESTGSSTDSDDVTTHVWSMRKIDDEQMFMDLVKDEKKKVPAAFVCGGVVIGIVIVLLYGFATDWDWIKLSIERFLHGNSPRVRKNAFFEAGFPFYMMAALGMVFGWAVYHFVYLPIKWRRRR